MHAPSVGLAARIDHGLERTFGFQTGQHRAIERAFGLGPLALWVGHMARSETGRCA